eukprot:2799935-Amphidinium_carterae.1
MSSLHSHTCDWWSTTPVQEFIFMGTSSRCGCGLCALFGCYEAQAMASKLNCAQACTFWLALNFNPQPAKRHVDASSTHDLRYSLCYPLQ